MKKRLFCCLLTILFCIGILGAAVFAADTALSMPTAPFNRLTFRYTAPTPAKLTITYKEGVRLQTDVLYLEAGENSEFSVLNKSYLAGKTAKNLKIISAEP